MKPIRTLFMLFAIMSMLVCSLSAQQEKAGTNDKVIGVELRTCIGDALTQVATIDIQNFAEPIFEVQTFRPGNFLIYSAMTQRPEQIDFGNYSKALKSTTLKKTLAYKKSGHIYRAKSHQIGYSCGGQGDMCS